MATFEFVKKFIKARDNFGDAITKSGHTYTKMLDRNAGDDSPTAESVEDSTADIEKGVDGVAPKVLKALKSFEKEDDEIDEKTKAHAKENSGSKTPSAPFEPKTEEFKKAGKLARQWLGVLIRAINDYVVKSDIASADSSGRFVRSGKEFIEDCDEILAEVNKRTSVVLKTAAKDATPPDLPPSDFQGEFRKILKANKFEITTESFARELKDTDARFKKLDGNRVYAKFQDLCKPALASLEDLIKDLKKFDPKKSKNDSDDDLKPAKLKDLAKDLEAFAKRVDEYDDRIFLFSRL